MASLLVFCFLFLTMQHVQGHTQTLHRLGWLSLHPGNWDIKQKYHLLSSRWMCWKQGNCAGEHIRRTARLGLLWDWIRASPRKEQRCSGDSTIGWPTSIDACGGAVQRASFCTSACWRRSCWFWRKSVARHHSKVAYFIRQMYAGGLVWWIMSSFHGWLGTGAPFTWVAHGTRRCYALGYVFSGFLNAAAAYQKVKKCQITERFYILLMHQSAVDRCFTRYAFCFLPPGYFQVEAACFPTSPMLRGVFGMSSSSCTQTRFGQEGVKMDFWCIRHQRGCHEMNCVKC